MIGEPSSVGTSFHSSARSSPLNITTRRQLSARLNGTTVFSFLMKSRVWSPIEEARDFTEGILFFLLNAAISLSGHDVRRDALRNMRNSLVKFRYSTSAGSPAKYASSGFPVSCRALLRKSSKVSLFANTCMISGIQSRTQLTVSVNMTAWELDVFKKSFNFLSKTARGQ